MSKTDLIPDNLQSQVVLLDYLITLYQLCEHILEDFG